MAEVAYLAALPKGAEQLPSVPQPRRGDRPAQLGHRSHGRERLRLQARTARRPRTEPLGVNPRVLSPNTYAAGFFAEEVRRELTERYGEKKLYEGGLSVRTTLDPKMQLIARKALVDGLVRYDEAHGFRGADAPHRDRGRLGRCRWPTSRRSATCSPGSSPSCST